MHCQEGLNIPPERWTVDCAVSEVRFSLLFRLLLSRNCHSFSRLCFSVASNMVLRTGWSTLWLTLLRHV